MNTGNQAALIAALLAMGLAACSGKTDTSTQPSGGAADPAQTHTASGAVPAEAQGAVQRDYPSAAEEAALKLDYPVFLPYGKDSARITPFFPGADQRPVSVKLAPHAAGYSLKLEGNQCQFPIKYELKSSDGSDLASGEYQGGAVDLPGWDANTGRAWLTLRMAEGAKNNFGCNLVVVKK